MVTLRQMTRRWIAVGAAFGLALALTSGGAAWQQRQEPATEPSAAERAAAETQATDQRPDAEVPGIAVEPAADGQPLIFRSGVNYIRVDAYVTDEDGTPVFDLTQDDFEVYEDGVKQDVDSFQVIRIDPLEVQASGVQTGVGVTRSDQELAASQPDVRVFVIFLDDYHVREGNGIRARRMLVDFLENELIPTDLVAVMYPLTPLDSVVLTRDHEAIIRAVSQFEGVKYEYEARNTYEARYVFYPTEVVERVRNDVSLSALRGLMIRLGGLREGRKSVLLVSEGYSNYVPPQLRSQNAEMPVDPGINPARFDPFAGDNSFEESFAFFRSAEILSDLRYIFRTANRFNTSIYTVDPRGLAVFEFDVSEPTVSFNTDRRQLRVTQDTLRILAEETGGRAIVNQNDLRPGLERMLTDANGYYLLGYNSGAAPTDGEFHEIEVRVSNPSLRVRARPGYWAITERDVQRAERTVVNEPPRAVDVALDQLAEPRRGRLVRTWLGTSRSDGNGKTQVTFVWEPTDGRGRRDEASTVLLTAMGDGGAYFRGRIPEEGAGERNWATFEVEPGELQLGLAIEGSGGEVLDRDRIEMDVPDYTNPEVVLSTPLFVRARNELEYRSLVDDWTVPPAVSRSFRRTERMLVRFQAYAPGGAVPEVEARLVNRAGETIVPLDVLQPGAAGADSQPASGGRGDATGSQAGPNAFQVPVALPFLPPGEYLIELTATFGDGETTHLAAFRLEA
ncbi:MAG: VWA domain-containing protein [Acidobacteria bacterium]|nr:VWA domain-containing protein [Acidobacteriota bacterium]MYJ03576.1 VWA domain-containing protein [Acidobacteriota bacterium]